MFVRERKFRFNNQSFVTSTQLAVLIRPFSCKRWQEPRTTYPTYFRQLKTEEKTVRKTEWCVGLPGVPS
jgi:hypothetical protein